MDKKTVEEIETRFGEVVQAPPYPVDEILELIAAVPPGKAEEMTLAALKALTDAGDFDGTYRLVKARKEMLAAKLQGAGIRDALRKTTKDRLLLSFIDSVGFGVRPLDDSFARLERLLAFRPGRLVLNQTWGLGEVKRIDSFYRRITIDFTSRRGHQMTFDAACETLVFAPEDHILVTNRADPARVQQMLKEAPGEFVKAMLKSFGDMPITRLEELSAQHGFVKQANWKAFWEKARGELRKDKLVEIPTRRTEPLHVKKTAETYGDSWFTAFSQMTDPKSILSSVRELQGTQRFKALPEADSKKIADRLTFALKGARGVDDALYARLAFCLDELKLDPAVTAKARTYLWTDNRYLSAARTLPARETESLVVFLTADDREARKHELFKVLPEMCFPFLTETLMFFKTDADCEDAVAELLKKPSAPATLVTLILGRYEDFKHWAKLPPLVVILTHAIALGEGRQSGETLRMQNMIRRLFADKKWLETIFAQLAPADQVLFFERFQASIAWDPSTHHLIVVRMTHIVPDLASRQVKKAEAPKDERITSLRSYAERKAAYQKLINVDIPENTRRIEFARSYGDLSENAEYQYAKDEQRALLQKQTLMQDELKLVKAVDFADVASDTVCPGTTVRIATADGKEIAYTVLGEWDNDLERGIIANKTRLAQNMLGKKAGETFDLPDADGRVTTATIIAVEPLSDALREWIKVPAGM